MIGVTPRPVNVEVHLGKTNSKFGLVGLPDTAVREARFRVRAALASSGYEMPRSEVTVNLAPADLPKSGSAFDLPIALGVLIADGKVSMRHPGVVAVGELALDGRVRACLGGRPARGSLHSAPRGVVGGGLGPRGGPLPGGAIGRGGGSVGRQACSFAPSVR